MKMMIMMILKLFSTKISFVILISVILVQKFNNIYSCTHFCFNSCSSHYLSHRWMFIFLRSNLINSEKSLVNPHRRSCTTSLVRLFRIKVQLPLRSSTTSRCLLYKSSPRLLKKTLEALKNI